MVLSCLLVAVSTLCDVIFSTAGLPVQIPGKIIGMGSHSLLDLPDLDEPHVSVAQGLFFTQCCS